MRSLELNVNFFSILQSEAKQNIFKKLAIIHKPQFKIRVLNAAEQTQLKEVYDVNEG